LHLSYFFVFFVSFVVKNMLTVEEALALVERHVAPLAPRRVPVGEAAGLVLAEEIVSEFNSPPYNKALMDGYAVRSGDVEPERQVLEEIAAGSVPRLPITPGTATRIMTGAPMPEGADAVVPIEQTEPVGANVVRLHGIDPSAGQNVLPLGSAMRAGDVVVHDGSRLRPIEIGILAEIGRAVVSVRPRPRVAVLPTGNEIVPIGEKLAQGQIRNSNGPMLVAAAAHAGAGAMELGIARDNRDELGSWIEQGLAADILLLSGGVSAGDFDLVPSVLAELRVEQVFHKISLRPGKPLWFGIRDFGDRQAAVFGLPGNPVSSFVCFELFVRPAISAMAGRGFVGLPSIDATLAAAFDHPGGRAAYLPARVCDAQQDSAIGTSTATVEILPWHGSADLATLAWANGLVRLPAEKCRLSPGASLEVLLI
jgi:molybdopterin molybdotransferase